MQSVSGAAVPPLFVTSVTSPQTNTQRVSLSLSSRKGGHVQHWELYSIPAAGYPKVEHKFRQFVAELLVVRKISYNGNTRPPAGSLMIG